MERGHCTPTSKDKALRKLEKKKDKKIKKISSTILSPDNNEDIQRKVGFMVKCLVTPMLLIGWENIKGKRSHTRKEAAVRRKHEVATLLNIDVRFYLIVCSDLS